jgi:hypothetical protein
VIVVGKKYIVYANCPWKSLFRGFNPGIAEPDLTKVYLIGGPMPKYEADSWFVAIKAFLRKNIFGNLDEYFHVKEVIEGDQNPQYLFFINKSAV